MDQPGRSRAAVQRRFGPRICRRRSVWSRYRSLTASISAVPASVARIQLNGIVLRGLAGQRRTKLGSVSIILNWTFFAAMLTLIASGGMLYFGIYAGHAAATLHWCATWISVAFAGLHLFTHYSIGGASQILRIFRPASLREPSPKLDAVELLTLLVEQSARLAPELEEAGRTSPSEFSSFARQHEIQRSIYDPRAATRRFSRTTRLGQLANRSRGRRSGWHRTMRQNRETRLLTPIRSWSPWRSRSPAPRLSWRPTD